MATLSEDGCVFCEIARGLRHAKRFMSWRQGATFEPLNPVTRGHLLVIPNNHVRDAAVSPSLTAAVFEEAARLAIVVGSCNLITSRGAEATQSVFHLHVHVVPRRAGDGLHLPWTNQMAAT